VRASMRFCPCMSRSPVRGRDRLDVVRGFSLAVIIRTWCEALPAVARHGDPKGRATATHRRATYKTLSRLARCVSVALVAAAPTAFTKSACPDGGRGAGDPVHMQLALECSADSHG
jgi:hypothetical protein